jgi:hypothetical protein
MAKAKNLKAKHSMFDLGNEWSVKPEAQKLEIQVYFRGIGGYQDTILTLVKLRDAGIKAYQYVMFDGEKFGEDEPRCCSGEAGIGITTFFMPENVDFIDNVYKVLMDTKTNPNIGKKHWLNDYDQYGKIQVRHRVNGGDWAKWIDDSEG